MSATTGPTEPSFFAGHDDETLRQIVDKYTSMSIGLIGSPLADNALEIANAAWAALALRGAA